MIETLKKNKTMLIMTTAAVAASMLIILFVPMMIEMKAYAELTVSGKAWNLDLDSYTGTKAYDGQPFAVPTAEELNVTRQEYETFEFIWNQDHQPLDSAPTEVGIYNLWIKVGDSTEYMGNYINGIEITPAQLTVTADSITKYVGDDVPTPTYKVEGMVTGESLDGLVTIKYSSEIPAEEGKLTTAGEYSITVSVDTTAAVLDNYFLTTENGTLTVSKHDGIDLSAVTGADGTYNGKAHLGYDADVLSGIFTDNNIDEGAYTIEYYSVATDGTESALQAAPSDAGSYKVTLSISETAACKGSEKTMEFKVAPAALTITAEDKTAQVGEAVPELTYTTEGLVEGEALTATPILSCDADMNTAGEYAITIASGEYASANYAVTLVNGKLTVAAAAAAPVFTPADGTKFSGSQKVAISCATEGASIYYTTDGTEPTTASTLYEGEFTISKTTTVKAIAASVEYTHSAVATAVYTKISSGGSGGGYGGGAPVNTRAPELNDVSMEWSKMKTELEKIPYGSDIKIELNGNFEIPFGVIDAIQNKGAKATIIIDSTRSWYVDGEDIEEPVSADMRVVQVASIKISGLQGTVGKVYRINGVSIPAVLNVTFDTAEAGKFAHLYSITNDGYMYLHSVRIDESGCAKSLDLTDKGEYVIMLSESDTPRGDINNDGVVNELDVIALLNDIVGLENAPSPRKRDYNGEGSADALDASALLIDIANGKV